MTTLHAATLACLWFLASAPAWAVNVASVKFTERATVGTADLVLNGAGLRTRFIFDVYAMGLYLTEKKRSAEAVLGLKGAKRIHIVTLRDLTAQRFADALVEGIQKNTSKAEFDALHASVEEFKATILMLKEAPKGAVFLIDFLPESGTQLTVSGQPKGKPIGGQDFYRALLRIWLGEKPVQQDLKDALLGQTE